MLRVDDDPATMRAALGQLGDADVDDCAINRQEVLRIRRRGLVRNEDVCLE